MAVSDIHFTVFFPAKGKRMDLKKPKVETEPSRRYSSQDEGALMPLEIDRCIVQTKEIFRRENQ